MAYGNGVMEGLGEPSKSSIGSGSVHYIDIFNVRNSEEFNIYIDRDRNKYDDGFKLQRYHKSLFCLIKYEIGKYIDIHLSMTHNSSTDMLLDNDESFSNSPLYHIGFKY